MSQEGLRFPSPERAIVSPVACPKCQLAMNAISFREWSVLLCPRCEGTFYDEAVLEALLSQPDLRISYLRPALLSNLASPHSPDYERQAVNCPSCHKPMVRESYSQENPLLVDRCPEGHGIWLDDGELGQLASEWESEYRHAEPGFWEALRRLLGLKPRLRILKRAEGGEEV